MYVDIMLQDGFHPIIAVVNDIRLLTTCGLLEARDIALRLEDRSVLTMWTPLRNIPVRFDHIKVVSQQPEVTLLEQVAGMKDTVQRMRDVFPEGEDCFVVIAEQLQRLGQLCENHKFAK